MAMLTELRVSGYRSLRDVRVSLGRVTVIVGPNGSGKTNLYSALRLAQHAALGTLARAIADEGGMPSLLWAGPRKRGDRARVELSVGFDDLVYELAFGLVPPTLPPAPPSPFDNDPEVKEERVDVLLAATKRETRRVTMLERKGKSAFGRDEEGHRVTWPAKLWDGESVLSQIRDPGRFPVAAELAIRLSLLRFYHLFPVERGSPIRAPQVGVRTGLLAHDGHDLAAALATIDEIGDGDALRDAIDAAFPGARAWADVENAVFSLRMQMPGLMRPLDARELSDGTLRFLCLAVALTAPRPPPFLALNEPESSLHPDVLPALAERIAAAASASQILVTTHSSALAAAIAQRTGVAPIALARAGGETRIVASDDDADD